MIRLRRRHHRHRHRHRHYRQGHRRALGRASAGCVRCRRGEGRRCSDALHNLRCGCTSGTSRSCPGPGPCPGRSAIGVRCAGCVERDVRRPRDGRLVRGERADWTACRLQAVSRRRRSSVELHEAPDCTGCTRSEDRQFRKAGGVITGVIIAGPANTTAAARTRPKRTLSGTATARDDISECATGVVARRKDATYLLDEHRETSLKDQSAMYRARYPNEIRALRLELKANYTPLSYEAARPMSASTYERKDESDKRRPRLLTTGPENRLPPFRALQK